MRLTSFGLRIWELADAGADFIAATDHEVFHLSKKDGARGATVAGDEKHGIRGLAVAFGHVVYGSLPTGPSGGTTVESNGKIVAYDLYPTPDARPIELGDCSASTRLYGGHDYLYAFDAKTHTLRRWSALDPKAAVVVSDDIHSVAELWVDGGRALWLDQPFDADPKRPPAIVEEPPAESSAALSAFGGPFAKPESAAPPRLARATFEKSLSCLGGDATSVYVLETTGDNTTQLVALDRKTWAKRVVASTLPQALDCAYGAGDVCVAELGGGTAAKALNARVLAVSTKTGNVREVTRGLVSPKCLHADGSYFYVTDQSGSLFRVDAPRDP